MKNNCQNSGAAVWVCIVLMMCIAMPLLWLIAETIADMVTKGY